MRDCRFKRPRLSRDDGPRTRLLHTHLSDTTLVAYRGRKAWLDTRLYLKNGANRYRTCIMHRHQVFLMRDAPCQSRMAQQHAAVGAPPVPDPSDFIDPTGVAGTNGRGHTPQSWCIIHTNVNVCIQPAGPSTNSGVYLILDSAGHQTPAKWYAADRSKGKINPVKDMARKTKEEALETRNRLIDTAEQVFYERGVSRTSLAEIAASAGVTRGAIYWHFKNKSDLFNAMFERVKLPLDELIEATLDAREPDPLECLRGFIVLCLRDTIEDPHRRRILDILFHKCEFTAEMGDVMQRHQTMVREGRARMEGGLRNAIQKGQLPADLDAHRAAVLLHGLLTGMLKDWLFTPDCINLAADAEQIVDAWFDMLQLSPALRLKTCAD